MGIHRLPRNREEGWSRALKLFPAVLPEEYVPVGDARMELEDRPGERIVQDINVWPCPLRGNTAPTVVRHKEAFATFLQGHQVAPERNIVRAEVQTHTRRLQRRPARVVSSGRIAHQGHVATSLPGAIPSGIVRTCPTCPFRAKKSILGVRLTSSGVRPPSASRGSSAIPSPTTRTYFNRPAPQRIS